MKYPKTWLTSRYIAFAMCGFYALMLALTPIQAKLVFHDNFERPQGALNLSKPSGDLDFQGVWSADGIPQVSDEGVLQQYPFASNFSGGWGMIDLGANATRDFNILVVEATVRRSAVQGGARTWFGFGFANNDNTQGTSAPPFGSVDGGPWLRLMEDGNAMFYGGPADDNTNRLGALTPLDESIKITMRINKAEGSYQIESPHARSPYQGLFQAGHNPNYRYLFVRWRSSDKAIPAAIQLEEIMIRGE